MADSGKTKKELLEEVKRLQRRIAELEMYADGSPRDNPERQAGTKMPHSADISERKQAENALRESEEKYRRVYEDSVIGMYRTTPDGQILKANPALLRMLGCSSFDDLRNRNLESSGYEPEYPRSMFLDEIEINGKVVGLESAWVRTDGSTLYVWESARAVCDESGKTLYFEGTVEDITERKQTENLIRQQRNLAVSLNAVSKLDEGVRICLEKAIEVSGMDCGGVYIRDETSDALNLVYHIGLSLDFVESASWYSAESASTQLVMAGEPVYSKHKQLGTPLPETRQQENLLAVAILPISHKDKIIGCMNVSSHHFDEVPLFARDVLEAFASQIGSAIARLRTEEALRESEQRFRTIFETAQDSIFIKDHSLRYTHINAAMERLFGLPAEELIGCTDDELFGGEAGKHIREVDSSVLDGQIVEEEHTKLVGDTLRTFHVIKVPMRDSTGKVFSLCGIARDITERKRAEEEIRKFKTISDSASHGVVIVDLEGTLLYINDCLAEMHGYTPDELLGKNLTILHNEEQLIEVHQINEDLKKNGSYSSIEVWHQHRNGSVFPTIMNAVFIKDADGEPRFLAATATDITEIRQLQTFAERAKRLEMAGRIAGQVAHDFNNLLGPLVAYPDLIKEELEEDHPVIQYIEPMEKAAQQIADINQQLLTLGRRGYYNLEPLNLNHVVTEVLKQAQPHTETLIIEKDLCDDLMNMMGGASQIFRVVANLIHNAVDAMQGIGKLYVRSENWYTDAMSGRYSQIPIGEFIKLTISDTGCGIPDDVLLRVFEPFFTTKTTDKRRGSGLGLSVVHAVVKDHDGYIDLASRVGEGTTVYLYFPITREVADTVETESCVVGTETILVVDDDQVQRDVTLTLLKKLGYDAHAVESGEKALEYLKEHHRDLLLLDMIMPGGIDGTETFARAQEINPEQKAVIISGFAKSERVAEAHRLGAGNYIRKPLTLKSISTAVRKELDCVMAVSV